MKIHDLTTEPVELTVDEQREIVGGFGFVLEMFRGSLIEDGLDATVDKYGVASLAGEISGRGWGSVTDAAVKGAKKAAGKGSGRTRQ
jgi:hypothetical protein